MKFVTAKEYFCVRSRVYRSLAIRYAEKSLASKGKCRLLAECRVMGAKEDGYVKKDNKKLCQPYCFCKEKPGLAQFICLPAIESFVLAPGSSVKPRSKI